MGLPPAGRAGLTDELRDQARAWAARSCLDHKLVYKIEDTSVVEDLSRLLRATVADAGGGGRPPRGTPPRQRGRPSGVVPPARGDGG